MFSTREIVIFLAGAETFHTLSHILLYFSGSLPIKFFSFKFMAQHNVIAIVINALITLGLFWYANSL